MRRAAQKFQPEFFRNLHHASPGRGVSGDDCRHSADGGFLHRRREREIVSAHLQDEFPRDRGHRAAGSTRALACRFRRPRRNRFRATPDSVSEGADRCTRGACAPHTDPQRDSIFTKGPSDVLDHATSEIASGSKLGIDATKKIPGEGFKRAWPPLIKMDEAVKNKINQLLSR
jgi:hypothetical protein